MSVRGPAIARATPGRTRWPKSTDAITELPEYYPTRTEASIITEHGQAMAEEIGPGSTFIDLGAGNCAKAARLLPLLMPSRYLAVDILGLGMDFSHSPALPDGVLGNGDRAVFFYPGSSIGNFALGVTAAFNLNLLRNLNRVAGTDFDPRQWRHVAFFDEREMRVEMHLEAREALRVSWGTGCRRFERGEKLHTENSYKYTVQSFTHALERAGFRSVKHWASADGGFAVFWGGAR